MKYLKILSLILIAVGPGWIYGQGLENYFSEAAEQNPGLKASYLEFEAALEQVEQANSLPELNFSFGYFISPVETRVGPQRAKFSISQMFPWFGTLKSQGDAATLLAEARYQEFLDRRNRLYFELAQAYYPLYELDQLVRIQTANLEILDSYKSIANRQFANGRGSMVDVLRVDLLINETNTQIEILEQKRKPLTAAFNNLLNKPDSAVVLLPDTLVVDMQVATSGKDSIASGSHPKVESFRLRTNAMQQKGESAARQAMPRFGVGIDYVLIDRRGDLSAAEGAALENNGRNALMPMVNMSIPLFNSRYSSARKEAEIMQEVYRQKEEEAINSLETGYEKVWFEMIQSQRLFVLYGDQMAETQQVLNLLFSAYSNEGNDFEELLRVQQRLLNYEMMRVSALVQYKVAEAELNYITAKSY